LFKEVRLPFAYYWFAMDTHRNPEWTVTRYGYLSEVHPDWAQVAPKHQEVEKLVAQVYSLPFEEFRKIPYRAPRVADNAPVPGKDVLIREETVVLRDGERISVRIYQPLSPSKNRLLFYNIHGGGELVVWSIHQSALWMPNFP
jgi:hypothetical protein